MRVDARDFAVLDEGGDHCPVVANLVRAGGERAAAIYSIIETAKLNGIEPQAYIADVIEKIASGWPASRWDELMPCNWRPAVEPAMAEAA
jgi:hypothetical protein